MPRFALSQRNEERNEIVVSKIVRRRDFIQDRLNGCLDQMRANEIGEKETYNMWLIRAVQYATILTALDI